MFRVPGTRVPVPSSDRTDSKSKLKAERAGINQFRASNRIRVRAQVEKGERERENERRRYLSKKFSFEKNEYPNKQLFFELF